MEYTSLDTQSQPQVAKALAQKAIDSGAYVVMGPVFSGSILVSMVETRRAEVPWSRSTWICRIRRKPFRK